MINRYYLHKGINKNTFWGQKNERLCEIPDFFANFAESTPTRPIKKKTMGIETTKLWRVGRDYFFITFGMALYAFGFCGFILPEKVVIGGLAGIGTIVYFLTDIPVAITQYALNLLLLAIAYKVVGKQFVLGTIYGATMISVFVGIFQPLLANGFTNEPFMNVVIGGACAGMTEKHFVFTGKRNVL